MHNSAVAINRMQNKSFFYIIYVCTVYIIIVFIIYYVYINNTHACIYFRKNMLCLYIKYLFININIDV